MTKVIGLVGTGVIGAGWAVRALARGFEVVVYDASPDGPERLKSSVHRAWPSARKLGLFPGADPERVTWAGSPAEVAQRADFIQESVPERLEVKLEVLGELDAAATPGTIIASSSSGLLPSKMQAALGNPDRFVVGHPFNPVYLLPLVEVVPGGDTDESTVDRAVEHYRDLAMHPLVVRNEIEGYLADRLQEAMWREILHLVNDGVATTEELDQAIIYGPGLRWAGMGTNLTFHLAGGEGGMGHMLEQFGPALELPWTHLRAPELSPELIESMSAGTADQAGGKSIKELEEIRDNYLIAVMRALRAHDHAAGRVIAEHEARIHGSQSQAWEAGDDIEMPLALYSCRVEPEWVDYNGHMTESAYLLAAGWATDKLFRYIGIDEDYRSGGFAFYTVETHIGFAREAMVDQPLDIATYVLGADSKRMHFLHVITDGESGARVAHIEQMALHVSNVERRSAPTLPRPRAALDAIAAAHAEADVGVQITMGLP